MGEASSPRGRWIILGFVGSRTGVSLGVCLCIWTANEDFTSKLVVPVLATQDHYVDIE